MKVLPSYTGTLDYVNRPLCATHEHFSFINLQPLGHRAVDFTPLYRGIPDQRDASFSHASGHDQIHASYLPVLFLLSPALSWGKQHLVTPLLSWQLPWQIRFTQVLTSHDSSLLSFTAVCLGLEPHCIIPIQKPGTWNLPRDLPQDVLFATLSQYLPCSEVLPHLRGVKMNGL